MKLVDYARHLGISYKTAWRWWKGGKLPHPARQTPTGTIIVEFDPNHQKENAANNRVAIYARMTADELKALIREAVAETLEEFFEKRLP